MSRELINGNAAGQHESVGVVTDDRQSWHARLSSFLSLEKGWNGYAASPPGDIAVNNALQFLDALPVEELKPARLSPSAVGGVGMTFRRAERKAYVEFYNDGKICALFSDGVSEPDTRN